MFPIDLREQEVILSSQSKTHIVVVNLVCLYTDLFPKLGIIAREKIIRFIFCFRVTDDYFVNGIVCKRLTHEFPHFPLRQCSEVLVAADS